MKIKSDIDLVGEKNVKLVEYDCEKSINTIFYRD